MSVSVIIPMRNEERFVGRCLDSILSQIEGRDDVEILCVDGASTDRTREIVQEYSRRDDRVKLIDNPDKIVPAAMNLAIARSRGDVIVRLDSHAEYAPDYIEKCAEVLDRTGADAVGGYVKTLPGKDTRVGRAIAAATSSRFGVGGSLFRIGGEEQETDALPFGSFKRETFSRFGLYDLRLVRNQDLELYTRIRRGGGRVIVSPEIRLTYYNRSTYSGLRQQGFQNGLWNVYTFYIRGWGLRVRHVVPLFFILSLIASGVLGCFWWWGWVLLGGICGVYTLVGSVMAVQAAAHSRASALLVLLAFQQLHVSYGIGSIWGLLGGLFKLRKLRSRSVGEAVGSRLD